MPKIAIVVGGAECVWSDCEHARTLCENNEAVFFVINDMISKFTDECEAVTLHPDKLKTWINIRQASGYPPPKKIWCHRAFNSVTNITQDWGGSSGLFSIKIAREQSYDRIILCGVPMEAQANHFVRHKTWHAAAAFRRSWLTRKNEIAPYVRSVSGWTAEQLGTPDAQWLTQ